MNSSSRPEIEHSHMLRSAKKLAHILGSTPFEFDLAGPEYLGLMLPVGPRPIPTARSNKSKRRHGLVYPKESTTISLTSGFLSSKSSLASTVSSASTSSTSSIIPIPIAKPKIKSKPAPLVFSPAIFTPSYNVNAVPFPVIVTESSLSNNSPLSPFVAAPATSPMNFAPLSGSTNVYASLRTPTTPEKIRKAAKLNRIFGENIPLEFIYPSTPKRATKRFSRNRTVKRLPIPAAFTPVTEHTENHLDIPNTSRRPSLADSISAGAATAFNRGGVSEYSPGVRHRSGHGLNRSQICTPDHEINVVVVAGPGWQGSWNADSMHDVRHKLRALK